MKMALLGVLIMAAAMVSATRAKKQFVAEFVVTGQKDGEPVVVAQPKLIAHDGQEASFLSGGEVPVDLGGGAPDIVSFGLSAAVKVHEVAPDRLRVSVRFGQSELEPGGARGADDFTIRESAVRCVRTIKPGETIEAKLDGGRTVKATITPVSATAK